MIQRNINMQKTNGKMFRRFGDLMSPFIKEWEINKYEFKKVPLNLHK